MDDLFRRVTDERGKGKSESLSELLTLCSNTESVETTQSSLAFLKVILKQKLPFTNVEIEEIAWQLGLAIRKAQGLCPKSEHPLISYIESTLFALIVFVQEEKGYIGVETVVRLVDEAEHGATEIRSK